MSIIVPRGRKTNTINWGIRMYPVSLIFDIFGLAFWKLISESFKIGLVFPLWPKNVSRNWPNPTIVPPLLALLTLDLWQTNHFKDEGWRDGSKLPVTTVFGHVWYVVVLWKIFSYPILGQWLSSPTVTERYWKSVWGQHFKVRSMSSILCFSSCICWASSFQRGSEVAGIFPIYGKIWSWTDEHHQIGMIFP